MRAGCAIVTGTDPTQTSPSGSVTSELDLMRAYSDRASVYTLIRKSRAVRKKCFFFKLLNVTRCKGDNHLGVFMYAEACELVL